MRCFAVTSNEAGTKITLHNAYLLGIALKGLDGLVETAGGVALVLVSHATIVHVTRFLAGVNPSGHAHGFITAYALHATETLSAGTQHFASAYLLIHGLIKVGLVAGLLRRWRAAYPAAVLLLTAFICYQVSRVVRYHSPALAVFTAIDIAIVLLIWREWRSVRSRNP